MTLSELKLCRKREKKAEKRRPYIDARRRRTAGWAAEYDYQSAPAPVAVVPKPDKPEPLPATPSRVKGFFARIRSFGKGS